MKHDTWQLLSQMQTLVHIKTNQVSKCQRKSSCSRTSIKTQQASLATKKVMFTSCCDQSSQWCWCTHKSNVHPSWSAVIWTQTAAWHSNNELEMRWLNSRVNGGGQRGTGVSTAIKITWRRTIAHWHRCGWRLCCHLLKFQQHRQLQYKYTTYK